MHIPKALCAECNLEMTCEKSSELVEMLMNDGKPYYKIYADRYGCPDCGLQIVIGFAGQAAAEHYQPDYNEKFTNVARKAHFAG